MTRTLPQIAQAAIINVKSGLKFEKDRATVYRDALHDANDLGFLLSVSRLSSVLGLLLRATKLCFDNDEVDPAAKLALSGLCDWVEAEMARQADYFLVQDNDKDTTVWSG